MKVRKLQQFAAMIVGSLIVLSCCQPVTDAVAQRPFRFNDTLYRGESASRTFFDQFAFTGEILYRPERIPVDDGEFSSAGPIGYSARLDYQLANQFDLSLLFDAVGSSVTTISVRWLSLTYYRAIEGANYAVRMAIDPVADGQGGFPQIDGAILYSAPVSQDLTSNITFGVRRVRIGLEQLVEIESPLPDPPLALGESTFEVQFSRALGWEVHGELRYSAIVDPGGSNAFFAVLGEVGSYELVQEGGLQEAEESGESAQQETDFRGGVIWLRSGLELARPSLAFTPFISLPVGQWTPNDDQWPRARLQIGLRLMVR